VKHKAILFSSIAAGVAFVAVFFGFAILNTPSSDAATIADFKAGNIIDDEVFYNKDAMTVAQIQAHLNKYNPTCDTWGTGAVGSGRTINGKAVPANTTRANYAKQMRAAGKTRYHDPPYICIQNYYENPTTHKTNFDTNGKVESGMISSAQIIYNAAQKYNINPQVLLVMLKKESYAWGDNWPLKDEYNTVMGYACPDNAACDTKYYGFYNQVTTAAWQLNKYKTDWENKTFKFNYRPGAVNNIYYSPTTSCGKKQVYIENIATASLYIYTPYTPNDAALKAYPGTANCGSYGNRNFFMYFVEWFGTTRAPAKPATTQQEQTQPKDETTQQSGQTTEQQSGEQQPAEQTTEEKPAEEQPAEDQQPAQTQLQPTLPSSPMIGAFKSNEKIIAAWNKLGGNTGRLGPATGNVSSYAPTNIVWQNFKNGLLVGNDKVGYWESRGGIRQRWRAMNGESGRLGFPTSNISSYKPTNIIWQNYEHGLIVGNDKVGYYESWGGIRQRWRAMNGESGKMGFPTSNISCYKPSNLCWQNYQGGLIVGNDKYGYWESSGKLRSYWRSNGGETGKMGYPTSNIKTSGKTIYQTYSKGTIYYNTSTKRYTWKKK